MRTTLLIVFLSIVAPTIAIAQESDESAEQESTAEEEKKKDFEWAVAPIPSRSPNLGWGLGAIAMAIYPVDSASPPAVSSLAGFWFQKGYVVAAFQKLHLMNDSLRITGGGGYLSFDFEYEQVNATPLPVAYNQSSGFVFANVLFEVLPKLYIGPRYQLTTTTFDPEDIFSEVFIRALNNGSLNNLTSGIGLILQHDTRDSQFFARSGMNTQVKFTLNPEFLGSESAFSRLEAKNSGYKEVQPNVVLAYRASWRSVHGDVPLSGLIRYGQGNDLRGYESGRYVGTKAFVTQGEMRWRFWWRFGLVMFAGVGSIFEEFDEWSTDDLLPSIGGGLRFLLAEQNELNYRIDFSIGRYKGNSAVYFSVGEAF